ncbi:MAG: alpha/beta fold hydrolase [Hyphomonadaceae bacterium]
MAFVRVPGNPEPDGVEERWFEGRGGARLRAMTAPALRNPARGSVILCNGRTEFIEKYFEVARELQERGFAVFTLDWRGQGLSDRLLPDRNKGHIDSLDEAVSDLALALKQTADRLPRPHILLAHSMGGAIGLRALQTRRIEVEGAVFSSPMWQIANLKPMARNFARFMTAIGAGAMLAPGQRRRWRKEQFKRNPVTHDRERHARAQALVLAEPRLALAGVTLGWIDAASEAIEGFRQPGALAHVRIPVVVLSAGEDTLVDNEGHDVVAKLLPQARQAHVAGAKHEILMERDELRDQFWRAFDDLADHVAPIRANA